MPKTVIFADRSLLYPDNWSELTAEDADEAVRRSIHLELPNGGFFSADLMGDKLPKADWDRWFDGIRDELSKEYELVDTESFQGSFVPPSTFEEEPSGVNKTVGGALTVESARAPQVERGIEHHFYYLDLLIVARMMAVKMPDVESYLAVHIQAESRKFEENELVFAALMGQLTKNQVR